MATKEEQNWAVILHLSVFAGYLVPLAGLVAPVVIWLTKRTTSEYLDAEGKELLNMMITALILAIVITPLCFILIGIPLAFALGIYCIVTPIVAAVKAGNGQSFKYPYTYKFLK